jgi:hypothetical protein
MLLLEAHKSSLTYSIPGDEAQLVASPSEWNPGGPAPGFFLFLSI